MSKATDLANMVEMVGKSMTEPEEIKSALEIAEELRRLDAVETEYRGFLDVIKTQMRFLPKRTRHET